MEYRPGNGILSRGREKLRCHEPCVSIAKDSRQTTLLVDLEFRNPSIAGIFALDTSCPGLTSYFFDGVGLEEILVNPGIEKLTVLPAGQRIAHASELIGSSRMEALIEELKAAVSRSLYYF